MTETNEKPSRAVRPRDAATLVLFRREAGRPKVLMGQRHRGHKVMPDAYVFPGGRVDRSDGYVPFARPLRPEVERKLSLTASPHRARALALAAVRETFEETGLILGEPGGGPVRRSPKGWQAYFDAGFQPSLDGLSYICHAITPPFRPQRFNARFFLADGERVEGRMAGSGELLHLDWLDVDDALQLNLPNITKVVLQQVHELTSTAPEELDRRPVPLHRMVRGKRTVEYL